MQEQIVNLVGNDDQLVRHLLLAQRAHQLDGLIERHIVIIVGLDDEHRRMPTLDR